MTILSNKKHFSIVTILFIALLSILNCGENDGDSPSGTVNPNTRGELIRFSDCGGFEDRGTTTSTSSQDCIEYEYDHDQNILNLTHINAAFNCCPGEITADITLQGNNITITEDESEAACGCDCLFDIEYQITDLPTGVYHIRIIELLIGEDGGEILEFDVNLSSIPAGEYCIERSSYPWGY